MRSMCCEMVLPSSGSRSIGRYRCVCSAPCLGENVSSQILPTIDQETILTVPCMIRVSCTAGLTSGTDLCMLRLCLCSTQPVRCSELTPTLAPRSASSNYVFNLLVFCPSYHVVLCPR